MASRPGATSRRSAKTEYIETDTGNKISRRAHIDGKQNIMLGGRTVIMAGVHLRGDLCRLPDTKKAGGEKPRGPPTAISLGKGCIVSTNCTLHPPMRVHNGEMTFYPIRIGDNVFIGQGTIVQSGTIHHHVHVGANCVLGPFSMIRESSKILPNSVVPAHMVVPPGSIVGGRPARIIGEVGDGFGQGGGMDGEEFVEGAELRALVRSIK